MPIPSEAPPLFRPDVQLRGAEFPLECAACLLKRYCQAGPEDKRFPVDLRSFHFVRRRGVPHEGPLCGRCPLGIQRDFWALCAVPTQAQHETALIVPLPCGADLNANRSPAPTHTPLMKFRRLTWVACFVSLGLVGWAARWALLGFGSPLG